MVINQEPSCTAPGCKCCHPLLKWPELRPAPKALEGRRQEQGRGCGMVINSCRLALPAAPAPGLSSVHLDKAEGSLKITLPAVTHGICGVELKGTTYRSPKALNQGEGQSGAVPWCDTCSRDARCALHEAHAPQPTPCTNLCGFESNHPRTLDQATSDAASAKIFGPHQTKLQPALAY